jgi:hypothetical protein
VYVFLIPLEGTSVFFENEAVVKNSTFVESVLKQKHLSIAYRHCGEAQAAGYSSIFFTAGEDNRADLLTKQLPGPRMRKLMAMIYSWLKPPRDESKMDSSCNHLVVTLPPPFF